MEVLSGKLNYKKWNKKNNLKKYWKNWVSSTNLEPRILDKNNKKKKKQKAIIKLKTYNLISTDKIEKKNQFKKNQKISKLNQVNLQNSWPMLSDWDTL